jgi:hypothetical protein
MRPHAAAHHWAQHRWGGSVEWRLKVAGTLTTFTLIMKMGLFLFRPYTIKLHLHTFFSRINIKILHIRLPLQILHVSCIYTRNSITTQPSSAYYTSQTSHRTQHHTTTDPSSSARSPYSSTQHSGQRDSCSQRTSARHSHCRTCRSC